MKISHKILSKFHKQCAPKENRILRILVHPKVYVCIYMFYQSYSELVGNKYTYMF